MPRFPHALKLERYGPVLQDRATVLEGESALFVAVADGAGGMAHGDRAADLVIRGLERSHARGDSSLEEGTWTTFLGEMDATIAGDAEPGETTAVVLAVTPELISGASVGDSEAWLVTPGGWHDLTSGQRRKPLLGSGFAIPAAFRRRHSGGVLVVGSDGLFKYANSDLIRKTARRGTPEEACQALIDLARLPGGSFQDDIAVVVCQLPASGAG